MTRRMGGLFLIVLVLVGCRSTPAAPPLTEADAVEFQARAFRRACADVICAGLPINAPADTPAPLRAALRSFTKEISYLTPDQLVALSDSDSALFEDRGTLFDVDRPWVASDPGVVAVDVFIVRGFDNVVGRTYLFEWDGVSWQDATPDGTGVTVTSSVS
jgi:hypothetical protein